MLMWIKTEPPRGAKLDLGINLSLFSFLTKSENFLIQALIFYSVYAILELLKEK